MRSALLRATQRVAPGVIGIAVRGNATDASAPSKARGLCACFAVLVSAFALGGCGAFGPGKGDRTESGGQPIAGEVANRESSPAFTLEVKTENKEIRDLLSRNLELERYRKLGELSAAEVSRLMVAAEPDARELLGTLGYFTPHLTLELKETPGSDKAPRQIVITVEPGPQTVVKDVDIGFKGAIATDHMAREQREGIVSNWGLPAGEPFTQSAWGSAKSGGLKALTARRYPTGKISDSKAAIDADLHQADLGVTYDSGPLYRFGPMVVHGSERYDADGARRIARLPVGQAYDQQKLLDAQQRLASSGYYDSVFLALDTSHGNPLAAPVIAQVQEAPLQKVVFGAGFSTDSGPRVSLDYTHNKVPGIGWRSVSKISLDRKNPLISTELTDLPREDGWRWFGSALLQREESGSFDEDSARLRAGQTKNSDHIDRSVFLQYDYGIPRLKSKPKKADPADVLAQNGVAIQAVNSMTAGMPGLGTGAGGVAVAPPAASTISINWGWTGRYFDNALNPHRGYGLSAQVGLGYTLLGDKLPFTRTKLRWLGIVPLDAIDPIAANAGATPAERRGSRLQLRVEAGAIFAKANALIPATQRFLTGGDLTVRGYGYREIGTALPNGDIVAGRYMVAGSVEWQRPIVLDGKVSAFESVVFVDAGAVADRVKALKLKVGTGAGVRWNSPVGLVQADLAYGLAVRKFRLHLRLGFTF